MLTSLALRVSIVNHFRREPANFLTCSVLEAEWNIRRVRTAV